MTDTDTDTDTDLLSPAVREWLRDTLGFPVSEAAPLASRSDNRAFRVVAGEGAYALKLVPPGRASALAHEAAITESLHRRGWPVPRTLATAALPGRTETATLRTWLPGAPAQAMYDAHPAKRPALAGILGATLARIHALPLDEVRGLWQFPEDCVHTPRDWAANFVQKKIASDCERIAPALPEDVRASFAAEMSAWGRWLAGQPVPLAPLHGDFYFENLLLDGGAVSGILDWEAARVGDPLWDAARTQVAAFADDAAIFARFRDGYRERVPWPVDDARVLRYRLLMAMGDLRYAVRHAPTLVPERVPPVLALWERCVSGEGNRIEPQRHEDTKE